MSKNDSILKCSGICKSYQMGTSELQVLKGVDMDIKRGEFISVVGTSGSGKSTLLHILGGLDRPDKGSVFFDGKDISGFSGKKMNEFRNKRIGFVFQFYHLLDELTVLENVLLPPMISTGTLGWVKARGGAKRRAQQLLEQLGLAERVGHKPFELSGGERQRAAIGRALINEPDVLLADEPTGNLDCATGNGILEVFGKLHADGQTIVMVTHDDKVAALANRVVRLSDGKMASQ